MSTALLLSGGMDSACIAWWRRPEVCITLDYGQKPAAAEIRAAAAVCAELGVEHLLLRVDLAALGSGDMAGRPQLAEAPVPEWWPFRNQMLVTLAAMLGVSRGIKRLLIGCLATDERHADGRAAFVNAMDALLAMQEGGLRLEAPAIAMTDSDLVRTSGIPSEVLAWAHSCHIADHACGMCRGCQKHYKTLGALGHAPY